MSGATGDRSSLRFNCAFFKASFFAEQLEEDAAHSSCYDGDGSVGFLAAGALLAVERSEVRRAADGHPARFDQSPAQPFVTRGQKPAVMDLASGTVRRRDHSGITAEFVGATEALDLIDLAPNHRSQG